VLTVSGAVSQERTVEVPFGTTIAAVIEAVEGVPLDDLDIKAVRFGGPTGVFLAGAGLQTPITYEALEEAGSAMGSASIEVFGGGRCAVEMARDVMSYLEQQSCGKCVSCREVTYQLADMLSDIAEFKGEAKDMEMIGELCEFMRNNSICGLGKNAGVPVLSSIRLFAGDYDSHLKDKRCPSGATG
jgi:NADH:ubiquinone oxidoreductase subunit F (NADH-binding)